MEEVKRVKREGESGRRGKRECGKTAAAYLVEFHQP